MTALSDVYIFDLISRGTLKIEPLIEDNIQPGSITLTLGKSIQVFKEDCLAGPVDLTQDELHVTACLQDADISCGYVLPPGAMVTCLTAEKLVLPGNVSGALLNRTSLASAGLNAAVSQYLSPGFRGRPRLVIKNEGCAAVKIQAGLKICELVLFKLIVEPSSTYAARHAAELPAACTGSGGSSMAAYMDRLIEKIALGKSS